MKELLIGVIKFIIIAVAIWLAFLILVTGVQVFESVFFINSTATWQESMLAGFAFSIWIGKIFLFILAIILALIAVVSVSMATYLFFDFLADKPAWFDDDESDCHNKENNEVGRCQTASETPDKKREVDSNIRSHVRDNNIAESKECAGNSDDAIGAKCIEGIDNDSLRIRLVCGKCGLDYQKPFHEFFSECIDEHHKHLMQKPHLNNYSGNCERNPVKDGIIGKIFYADEKTCVDKRECNDSRNSQ